MKIGGNLMDENDEGNVKNALNYLKSYKMDADAQQKTKVDDDIELEQEQSNKYGYPNLLADTTLERRYIGSDISQEYCRIANKRLEKLKGEKSFNSGNFLLYLIQKSLIKISFL